MLTLSTYLLDMPSSRKPGPGRPQLPARRKTYHHGDLRQALIDAALELLRAGGAEALTLRAVARAAGVSQAAPYRHFADRSALVGAVAQESFARMGASIERAVQRGPLGPAALKRGMVAYVRFAHEHPAEYRVMFGAELADRRDLPDLAATALGTFALLREGIARNQQAGALSTGDPMRRAVIAWATLHGLVMLSLDGQTAVTGDSIETLADAATELLLAGMGGSLALAK